MEQMTIFDLLKEEPKEIICKHSGHTCNKEELWKIAESFDDLLCHKVCCRQCHSKLCGARCNGSKEPEASAWDLFHEHCKHGGSTRYNEELGRTQHLCSFANGRPARSWADWIECTECDCYIVRSR